MAIHSSMLAWKIPWTEKPGRLQSKGSLRVRHDKVTSYFHFPLSLIGEGNGNPLQWSCLENPRDGGAWWAAVYGVAQSRTRLKRLSSSSKTLNLAYPWWYMSSPNLILPSTSCLHGKHLPGSHACNLNQLLILSFTTGSQPRRYTNSGSILFAMIFTVSHIGSFPLSSFLHFFKLLDYFWSYFPIIVWIIHFVSHLFMLLFFHWHW